MGRCGWFWIVLGSLWIVLDHFGSFWVVPRFNNYDKLGSNIFYLPHCLLKIELILPSTPAITHTG